MTINNVPQWILNEVILNGVNPEYFVSQVNHNMVLATAGANFVRNGQVLTPVEATMYQLGIW